jgi:hypothetical protein
MGPRKKKQNQKPTRRAFLWYTSAMETNTNEWTPSGLSKFLFKMDAAIYEMALEGADEVKTYHNGASLSLVLNIRPPSFVMSDWTPARLKRLPDDERVVVDKIRAAIVRERSDGVVTVYWFQENARAIESFAKFDSRSANSPLG